MPRLPEEPFTNTLSYMSNNLITISPEIMGGMPVFGGTRVPVQTLFEYLEAGDTQTTSEAADVSPEAPQLAGELHTVVQAEPPYSDEATVRVAEP